MPPAGTIIIVLLVLVFIVGFVIPLARNSKPAVKESFDLDPATDLMRFSRDDMIHRSQKMYNKFSDSQDVRNPTFISSDDPDDVAIANRKIRQAMYTSDVIPDGTLKPVPGTPTYAPAYKTLMATNATKVTAQLPPPSGIITMAKKCETLKTRDSCRNLDDPDYKYCGVCIEGGTDHTQRNPGKHIGGLLILPDDRRDAEDAAREAGTPVQYTPTVGSCAPGKFFLQSDVCTQEGNRQNCLEIGQTGGFVSGKTVEGKTAAAASCAQVPTVDENLYIYNPTGRTFSANLRVLTPLGTGKAAVYIYNSNNNLIASDNNIMPGRDSVITIPGVQELQELTILIAEEVPLRKSGKPEVFICNENGSGNHTRDGASALCNRIGAKLATKEQLTDAWRNGAQQCNVGHTTDGAAYPTKGTRVDTEWKWSNWWYQTTVYNCGYGDQVQTSGNTTANAWCYGVKPPKSTNQVNGLRTFLGDFFSSYGNNTTPAQGDSYYSQYSNDPDYQGPLLYRAVLLQWEMVGDSTKRTVPFETTITKVDKYSVSAASGKALLKRFGTFSGSSAISQPKPGSSEIMRSTQWLWGKDPLSQQVVFNAQIPGVLQDPLYKQDKDTASRGPILNNPATQKLLNSSPCLKEGQIAGHYSVACLLNLFSGVGGDPQNGKLARDNGGLTQLNSLGDSDAIAAYLYNLYSLARTGRDSDGNTPKGSPADRAKIINDASQKLYGFDIATPCEEIVESDSGDIQLRPKNTPLTSECLNYLWLNTNSDKDRYNETRTGSTVRNTYIAIGDRFSGLMNSEGTQSDRDKYPFQACQLNGSLAPVQNGQRNLANMAAANAKGSVQAVQDFYNSVHKTANYSSVPADQTLALQQCYGVARNPNTAQATACSIPTRYVRVLSNSMSNQAGDAAIQIPQIEVFDNNGNEVAKGRPTYSSSSCCGTVSDYAVNGKAYPHSHAEGEFHALGNDLDNDYWMVDLGRTVQVQEVRYYPRTDCCSHRQLAAPIQLLNDRKQVMAEKLIESADTKMQSLTFTNSDMKPAVPISLIIPGLTISLRSAIHFNRILRNSGFQYWIHGPDMAGGQYSPAMRNDGTLKIIPAKNGMSDHVTFESINYPNQFLGHSIGAYRIVLASALAFSAPPEYMNIISFKPVPALNGNPSMVSWMSGSLNKRRGNANDYYIAVDKNDSKSVILDKTNGTLRDVERFCWTILPGLA